MTEAASQAEAVAAVLAAHRRGDLLTALDKAWVDCSCGEKVSVPVRGLSVSWSEAQAAYEAHRAQALVDAGYVLGDDWEAGVRQDGMEGKRMSRLGFLTDHAWMDENGVNVWVAHDCDTYRDVSMFPSPQWSAREAGGRREVTPSIDCSRCGYHNFPTIGEICHRLGRDCSREPGHHGACALIDVEDTP